MTTAVQVFVNGLISGGILGLVALGLTVIFGVMRVVNFAHGEFVTIGAYLTWLVVTYAGVDPLLSLIVSLGVGWVLGWITQRILLARVVGRPDLEVLLLTYGVSVMLVGIITAVFSGNFRGYSRGPSGFLRVGDIVLGMRGLIALGAAVALVALAVAILQWTRIGKGIRALAQHRAAAAASGVDVPLNEAIAFAAATALAAGAGTILSLIETLTPVVGRNWLLDGFVVVVLGGLGSVPGSLIAALGIGVIRAALGYVLDDTWARVLTYMLLFVLIVLRPQGLLGREEGL
jgi:branched-chain amino acid transport system permease protein